MEEKEKTVLYVVQSIFGLLILTVTLLCLIGCSSYKEIPVNTVEKIVYKDTTIVVRDSIYIEVPKEVIKEIVPKDTTSILRTSVALSEAKIDKGMLYHSLEQKGGFKAQIDTVVTVKYVDRFIEKEVPVQVEVIKYRYNTVFWISILLNLVIILIIAFKIYLKNRFV